MSQALALRTPGARRSYRRRRVARTPLRRTLVLSLVAVLALIAVAAAGWIAWTAPTRAVVRAMPAALAGAPAEVAAFYQARGQRPFWLRHGELRPEARQMADIAARALPAELPVTTKAKVAIAMREAGQGTPEALARAEVALSTALAQSAATLRPNGQLAFIDPELPARPAPTEALEQAAATRTLSTWLTALAEPNPVYADLRRQYAAWRGPPAEAALIEKNLQRARILPPVTGRRFILVNPAARELVLYEDGKPTDTMRVIVGSRREQTPMMAGLLRHMVFNPYWDVPVDMVRDSIAPRVIRAGAGTLAAERFQVLSDWGDDAVPMEPSAVDWAAVAGGAVDLPVRQLPGGDNMMGQVKFMLPNELGIYLHDTPHKHLFGGGDGLLSAGCVRLERAHDLVRWLLGKAVPGSAQSSHKVVLDEPVPVYITYLTAAPGKSGVVFHPDVYGRDAR